MSHRSKMMLCHIQGLSSLHLACLELARSRIRSVASVRRIVVAWPESADRIEPRGLRCLRRLCRGLLLSSSRGGLCLRRASAWHAVSRERESLEPGSSRRRRIRCSRRRTYVWNVWCSSDRHGSPYLTSTAISSSSAVSSRCTECVQEGCAWASRHVHSSVSRSTSIFICAFRLRLRHIVIVLAEWTRCTTSSQPWIDAGDVVGVSAS